MWRQASCTARPLSAYFKKMVSKNQLPPQLATPSAGSVPWPWTPLWLMTHNYTPIAAEVAGGLLKHRCTQCLPALAAPWVTRLHRLALALHLGTTYHLGAAAVAMLWGMEAGSQPSLCCSRASGEAVQGLALSQPGAEADLHPSVGKYTQIISPLRGIGIPSRWLKEERQQALSRANNLPRHWRMSSEVVSRRSHFAPRLIFQDPWNDLFLHPSFLLGIREEFNNKKQSSIQVDCLLKDGGLGFLPEFIFK